MCQSEKPVTDTLLLRRNDAIVIVKTLGFKLGGFGVIVTLNIKDKAVYYIPFKKKAQENFNKAEPDATTKTLIVSNF